MTIPNSLIFIQILNIFRTIATIVIGVVLYGDEVVRDQLLGYSVALFGFFYYNVAKLGYFDELPTKQAHRPSGASA
jgi:hypothetical protein